MGEIDEAELLGAGQRGVVLDGMADGRKRIVQAGVLRACCREFKDRVLSSIFVLSLTRLSRTT